LAINENADADVRRDMEAYFSKLAPENEPYFQHTLEGADDMPGHLKTVLIGCQLTLPIGQGEYVL
jgi:secondary thiamine-phosphate synthase enzyme